jgi:hypothetical protein
MKMMYPFMTLDDETEITHSEFLPDNKVKVYVEKADVKDGFHDMTCYLPGYEITSVHGFSKEEQEIMDEGYERAVKAAVLMINDEIERAMNDYNGKN